MTRVVWRLHRNQVLFGAIALAALAIALVVTGLRMSHDFHVAVTSCTVSGSCSNLNEVLFQGDGFIIDLVNATAVVPLLFGLFWGGPLVSKEMEDGTNILAWTQSVTRRRWMNANVAWVLAAAAVWGGAMSALVTWWRYPENALSGRFGSFDIQGFVPVAYSVFAVALGIAAGAFFRRVLPALAVTLGTFTVVRLAVTLYARPHYLAPYRQLFALSNGSFGPPPSAWLIGRVIVSPSGRVISSVSGVPGACRAAYFGNNLMPCMQNHGYRRLVTYQPDSRFWAFQGIESVIFLALSAGLLLFAYHRVLTRDA